MRGGAMSKDSIALSQSFLLFYDRCYQSHSHHLFAVVDVAAAAVLASSTGSLMPENRSLLQ